MPAYLNGLKEMKSMSQQLNMDTSKFSNHTLYRFLKARNFDVKKAAHMLKDHIKWREENLVDTLVKVILSKFEMGIQLFHSRNSHFGNRRMYRKCIHMDIIRQTKW